MRTIVVATDFSPASLNAMQYAGGFAKSFNAKLILFHAFRFMYPPVGSMIVSTGEALRLHWFNELEKLGVSLSSTHDLTVEAVVEDCINIHDSIINFACQRKGDLLVLGTKHHSNLFRKFFGTTITALHRKTILPILIIPQKSIFIAPKIIALANDLRADTNIHILDPLREIGEEFNARVLITRILKYTTDEIFEQTHFSTILQNHLASLNKEYVYINHDNVEQGLQQCIDEKSVDLLVMVPHKHTLFDKIFISSHTNSMLHHIQIPMLVLPEQLQKPSNESLTVEKYLID